VYALEADVAALVADVAASEAEIPALISCVRAFASE
jgi:hypothetical protein